MGGIMVALVVPIFYMTLAELVRNGTIRPERTDALFMAIYNVGTSALAELVMALVGIRLVGTAFGMSRPPAWAALLVLGVPVLFVTWFIAVATFGGVMGDPF